MSRLWPILLLCLAVYGLGHPPPDGWPLDPGLWVGLAGVSGLAGVFGLLHLSSHYLQARVVALAWLVTRDPSRANLWYFRLMRPGVLVHELAHAMAAAVVGGRVLAFNALETSVVPGARGGQVRLGHVAYTIPGRPGAWTARLRDAFVGLAPLPFGLLLIGGALALSGVDWGGDLAQTVPAALPTWQFWLALVAIIQVADNMTPSAPDRKNWPAALLTFGVLGGLVWTVLHLLAISLPAGWVTAAAQAAAVLAAVLVAPIALNLLFGVLLWLLTRLFHR
ncbi:MAG TPA: hypothetical protein VM536_23075 [Chloroflexia bacterium]|nr:hypothetical protein [Chloroflexia bacterium]